jgi:hypothetical protein
MTDRLHRFSSGRPLTATAQIPPRRRSLTGRSFSPQSLAAPMGMSGFLLGHPLTGVAPVRQTGWTVVMVVYSPFQPGRVERYKRSPAIPLRVEHRLIDGSLTGPHGPEEHKPDSVHVKHAVRSILNGL